MRRSHLIVMVALAVTSSGCFALVESLSSASETASSGFHPPTGFGGYRIYAETREVSAHWTVPAIGGGISYSGAAATWIGAQELNKDFIQIGILENKSFGEPPYYQAFWSDTAKKFAPQVMGTVGAGQKILASMKHTSHGWTLKLVDKTWADTYVRKVSYGGNDSFTEAEWIQEDPAPSISTPVDVPYPKMTAPVFSNLELNDQPPHFSLANAQVLIPSNRSAEVPTKLRGDSFTLLKPSGIALTYLKEARQSDRVASHFDYALTIWSSLTRARRTTIVTDMITSLTSDIHDLKVGDWPRRSREPARRMRANFHGEISDLREWRNSDLSTTVGAYQRFVERARDGVTFADETRASIGLPPT